MSTSTERELLLELAERVPLYTAEDELSQHIGMVPNTQPPVQVEISRDRIRAIRLLAAWNLDPVSDLCVPSYDLRPIAEERIDPSLPRFARLRTRIQQQERQLSLEHAVQEALQEPAVVGDAPATREENEGVWLRKAIQIYTHVPHPLPSRTSAKATLRDGSPETFYVRSVGVHVGIHLEYDRAEGPSPERLDRIFGRRPGTIEVQLGRKHPLHFPKIVRSLLDSGYTFSESLWMGLSAKNAKNIYGSTEYATGHLEIDPEGQRIELSIDARSKFPEELANWYDKAREENDFLAKYGADPV